MEAIRRKERMQGAKASGTLANLSEPIFSETSVECQRKLGEKAMVLRGLDVGYGEKCRVEPLNKPPQGIIARYPDGFTGGYQEATTVASV
ncbi:hypothetical protein PHMEG_0006063 [Phytophthora megakarya]|uniref:Uncharacterized protein n=1 Tax=Phytophthora megakarya TaxID=4795 RepID=A0A225WRI1_9STRA|nr:hypothetical protein PHMEG_0006063 [Phytophthora megakarya]